MFHIMFLSLMLIIDNTRKTWRRLGTYYSYKHTQTLLEEQRIMPAMANTSTNARSWSINDLSGSRLTQVHISIALRMDASKVSIINYDCSIQQEIISFSVSYF